MKKLINTVVLSICLGVSSVVLVSCEDLLETRNFTDMTPDNFFKTEGDIAAAVTGLYVPLTTNWGYSDGGTGGWYNALFNVDLNAYYPTNMVTTDMMQTYSYSDYEAFNVAPATSGPIVHAYNIVRFIARTTDVLNQIERQDELSEEVRNRFIAEVKTLRAFYMFTMLDWFGPVNAKLDPETLTSNQIDPRPSLEEYVAAIEQDLAHAVSTSSFPDKYNSDVANWGRMSKAIAYGVQMKLYMHQKNWTKVKEATEQLMTMGYSLLGSYEDVFNLKRTSEHIWSIPSEEVSDNWFVTEVLPSDFKRGYNHLGKPYIRGNNNSWFSGWQVYCMRWEFYDTFDNGDVRKQAILAEYEANDGTRKRRGSGMTGALPIKFTDSQYAEWGIQKDHPVIRYADVLLSYAEAENELNGPTESAVRAVREITDRAQTEIPNEATNNKEDFRDFLLAERGRELFCEGHRRQDLIRHGVFIKRAKERGNDAKDYQVLFPIPQFAIIEAGGILEQNDGYTN